MVARREVTALLLDFSDAWTNGENQELRLGIGLIRRIDQRVSRRDRRGTALRAVGES